MTEVAAALIRSGDRFMICQRPAHKARGLLWEFAGGKLEPGETGEDALVRECREELGVTVAVGDVYMEVTHEYPDLTVRLTVYETAITEGEPQKLEHADIRWITAWEADAYGFCPADEDILAKLRTDAALFRSGIKREVVSAIRALAAEHGLTRVTLFGSRARGDHWRASDIDLAAEGGDIAAFAADVDERAPTLLMFDVVDLGRTAGEAIKKDIERDGVVIYEKV